jgi:hypothetical protein
LQALAGKWASVVSAMERLDYSAASLELPAVEKHSHKFKELALEMVAMMHPVRCVRRRRLQLSWLHLTGLAILLTALALVQVLRPKTFKPKIN